MQSIFQSSGHPLAGRIGHVHDHCVVYDLIEPCSTAIDRTEAENRLHKIAFDSRIQFGNPFPSFHSLVAPGMRANSVDVVDTLLPRRTRSFNSL